MSGEKNKKSFYCFATLMALCAAAHVSVHLPIAELSAGWLLGVSVFLAAMWLIYRTTVKAFLLLAVLQVVNVVFDAPYNPDHWLLVFFVNLVTLGAAFRVWRREGSIGPDQLMEALAPGARLVFLICYGFAAFAKYNSDFLFNENSVAREMLDCQAGAMPLLSWLVWAPAVPWVTLACESAVPLLLIPNRTRYLGILVGIVFHAALIISPAVKVYDFTIVVYTMLYLFTPASFDTNLRKWRDGFRQRSPHLANLVVESRRLVPLAAATALIAVSTLYPLLEIPPQLLWVRWMFAMGITCCLAGLCCVGLFSGERRNRSETWFPRMGFSYAVLVLAILNGLCPYLGLKTQGSFTMFSNLRTEAGAWNHLLMPASVRLVDRYQDRLVQIVASNDPVLNQKYVERELLAPEFEVRRRIMDEPSLSLTTERNGQEVILDRADRDTVLGSPLDPWSRKLLIFRPVSRDGRAFTTN